MAIKYLANKHKSTLAGLYALLFTIIFGLPSLSQADEAWFLESNMVNLDASNRYLSSLVVINPGKGPIYLKVTVSRIELVDGVRKVSPDADGVLKAIPQQFVLRPGESFPVRLLVDLNKQTAPSQSYYVNVTDVSNLQPNSENSKSDMATGFLLAYEALVSVQTKQIGKLTPSHFAFKRESSGKFALQNLSGQHIVLNRGDACPDAQTLLVNCSPVKDFPLQTMLPGETLTFPAFSPPVLGLLAIPQLNNRARVSLLYLEAPHVQ